MKYSKKEAGNILFNSLLVLALFTIAYVWYAQQSNVNEIQVVSTDTNTEDLVTKESPITSSADTAVSNIQNGIKSVAVPQVQNKKQEDIPTPLNRIVLAETETGNFVTIAFANLIQPAFIAIYKVNNNGETLLIGNTGLLPAGIITNYKIQLESVVVDNQTIAAVLHTDDGDGKFEFPESDPYLKNADQIIVSDVDIVEINADREAAALKKQVETYLENNF